MTGRTAKVGRLLILAAALLLPAALHAERRDWKSPKGSWLQDEHPRAPAPVLSLVVSGKDPEHVLRHVKRLRWLKEHRGVRIGDVLITDTNGFASPEIRARLVSGRSQTLTPSEVLGAAVGPVYPYLKEAGVPQYRTYEAHRVLKRLDLQYSPTWVVRHLGRDYIFEGFTNPTMLFNRRGEFVRD